MGNAVELDQSVQRPSFSFASESGETTGSSFPRVQAVFLARQYLIDKPWAEKGNSFLEGRNRVRKEVLTMLGQEHVPDMDISSTDINNIQMHEMKTVSHDQMGILLELYVTAERDSAMSKQISKLTPSEESARGTMLELKRILGIFRRGQN